MYSVGVAVAMVKSVRDSLQRLFAPTQAVNGESASSTAYLRNIVKISAGAYHNIALSDDSSVYAWGRNANGQLGNNTITTNDSIDNANNYNANSPKRVLISYDGENMQNLDGIVNVNAGVNSSMAVGRDGYLYSWGSGANNTTGVGSTANSLTAKYIQNEAKVSIAMMQQTESVGLLPQQSVIWVHL